MRFDHDRLRLELDDGTGSIASISDIGSGRRLFDAGSDRDRLGRLFRVIAPIERWSSHAADSWRSPAPQIRSTAGGILLRYQDLHSSLGPIGVSGEVEITRGGPSEAILRLRLTSQRTEGDVTDVLFPWLGGWCQMDAGENAVVLGGTRSIETSRFPVNRGMTFSRWHQREFFTYPIDLYAPWLDVSGADGGIGVVSYQETARNLGAFLENLAGYDPGLELSLGLNHFLQLRAGETWQSPAIGISVHQGDWHATADRYRSWVDTWFQPPPTPEWARRTIGFQNVLFRGFDGTPIRPLESIPDVARAGVRAGVPHLSVWDYVLLGDYGKLDDVAQRGFLPADRETLLSALTAARGEGAHLSSLQNYRLVKPTSQLFRDEAHAEVCRRYDGSPFVEEYCGSLAHAMVITTHVGPMVHPVDPRIPSVEKRVLEAIAGTLDLGFDSHFYDQPFENWPSYHPGRGDDGPDGAHAGTVSLLGKVRRLLASRSPGGIMIGEYCDVFGSQAVDVWMSWYTDFADLLRSAYSIPQTLQSWVVDCDPAAAAKAFTIGAQLCLTTRGGESHLGEVPEFAERVSSMAALRRRAERVWRGRFQDEEGVEVESDGPVVAGAFSGSSGPAIAIGSPGTSSRLRLRIDSSVLRPSEGGGRLLRLEGGEDPTSSDRLELELDANEVAVWYV